VLRSTSKFYGIAAMRAGIAWCADHERLKRLFGKQENWGLVPIRPKYGGIEYGASPVSSVFRGGPTSFASSGVLGWRFTSAGGAPLDRTQLPVADVLVGDVQVLHLSR
jgi:hypothetical protein